MSDIHLPHTIFDPSSRYNRLRLACDPREKLVGFFDWLDYKNKRGIAPSVPYGELAASGPVVIRLDDIDKPVPAYVEIPEGDELPDRYEVRFELEKIEDRPAGEIPCRVLLLEAETFKRLRKNLAAEGRPLPEDDEEAIRRLLREDFLESKRRSRPRPLRPARTRRQRRPGREGVGVGGGDARAPERAARDPRHRDV